MRSKTDILLAISFTVIIIGAALILHGENRITGYAAGNAKVCVGNTPNLVDIGNLSATTRIPFYYDVNHTIANDDPVLYADTASFFTIDDTGIISFTPQEADIGNHTVIILVNNTACTELGDMEELNFEIIQGNRAPVLDTIGNHQVVEDTQWYMDVNATDPDGDNITYACNTSEEAPYNKFTINETTGIIDWWPSNDDVGLNWFECNATDDYGASDSETFYINVTNVNDIPILELIHNFTVESGEPLYEDASFYYDVNATDPEGDTIVYLSNHSMPIYKNGEDRISPTTGEIYFVPFVEDIGNYSVIIKATDNIGPGIAQQEVFFEILAVNDPPSFEPPIGAKTARIGKLFLFDVNAWDEEDGSDNLEGTGNLTFSDDTILFNIDPLTGVISFIPTDADLGNYSINISVTDSGIPSYGLGNITFSEIISLTIALANRPPNITSYSPETPFSMETGQSQDFTITAEDPDGGTPSAKWYLDNSEINGSTAYTYTFTPSTAGTYNLTIVITDGELDDSQEWVVTVTTAPTPPGPAGPAAPGGGGGFGGKYFCKELWICTDWSKCMISDIQIRTCKDLKECNTRVNKPPEVRSCIFVPIETCFDEVRNQDEILPDCGGVCKPCPTCSDGICNQGEQCEICQENPEHPRCPRDLESNIMPDCGGPCPLCPKIEKLLSPKSTNWKAILISITEITVVSLLLLLIALIILIKIMRRMSKKAVLTEQEKAELDLVNEINNLITYAEKAIDMKDMERLKMVCANIENLYNSLSSTKNKTKIYPKIKRLKRAIKIGF